MVCNVTAFPKLMHVNWRQNNSGILRIINEGAVGTDGISPNNPSLTLKSTSFADTGVYHCSATNMAGTERSVAIHLSVIGGKPTLCNIYFISRIGSSFSCFFVYLVYIYLVYIVV